jgi:hypothetical protein
VKRNDVSVTLGTQTSVDRLPEFVLQVDKYSRVAHPEIEGFSGRTRIERVFQSHGDMPTPFFPPKWGINDKIIASGVTSPALLLARPFGQSRMFL